MFNQIVDKSLSENSNFESIEKLVSNYNEQVGEDFDFKTYIYDFETKQMVSVKSLINNQGNTHLTKNTLDQYAIIGLTDGRTRVNDVTASPYSGIVYVRGNNRNQYDNSGTGAFVSDTIVVTAAHNCFETFDYNGDGVVDDYDFCLSMEIFHGDKAIKTQNTSCTATRLIWSDYVSGADNTGSDIALLTINRATEKPHVNFIPTVLSDESLESRILRVTGYPGFVGVPLVQNDGYMYTDTGIVSSVYNDCFNYSVDTSNGQS